MTTPLAKKKSSGRQRVRQPPPGKVPRPPNAYICYRSERLHERRTGQFTDEFLASPTASTISLLPFPTNTPKLGSTGYQAEISKTIGQMWRAENATTKDYFYMQSSKKLLEHREMYPNYRFKPRATPKAEQARSARRKPPSKSSKPAKTAKTVKRESKSEPSSMTAAIGYHQHVNRIKAERIEESVESSGPFDDNDEEEDEDEDEDTDDYSNEMDISSADLFDNASIRSASTFAAPLTPDAGAMDGHFSCEPSPPPMAEDLDLSGVESPFSGGVVDPRSLFAPHGPTRKRLSLSLVSLHHVYTSSRPPWAQ